MEFVIAQKRQESNIERVLGRPNRQDRGKNLRMGGEVTNAGMITREGFETFFFVQDVSRPIKARSVEGSQEEKGAKCKRKQRTNVKPPKKKTDRFSGRIRLDINKINTAKHIKTPGDPKKLGKTGEG